MKISDLILNDCYTPPMFLLEKSVQQSGLPRAQEASDDLQTAEESRKLLDRYRMYTLARRNVDIIAYSDRNPVIHKRALHIDDILWDRRC